MKKVVVLCIACLLAIICIPQTKAICEEYTYDEFNRVICVVYDNGDKIEYDYDKNGNIVKIRVEIIKPEETENEEDHNQEMKEESEIVPEEDSDQSKEKESEITGQESGEKKEEKTPEVLPEDISGEQSDEDTGGNTDKTAEEESEFINDDKQHHSEDISQQSEEKTDAEETNEENAKNESGDADEDEKTEANEEKSDNSGDSRVEREDSDDSGINEEYKSSGDNTFDNDENEKNDGNIEKQYMSVEKITRMVEALATRLQNILPSEMGNQLISQLASENIITYLSVIPKTSKITIAYRMITNFIAQKINSVFLNSKKVTMVQNIVNYFDRIYTQIMMRRLE